MSSKEMDIQEEVGDLQDVNSEEVDLKAGSRQRIINELKCMDPSVFVVPGILYAKNSYIIDTKEHHRKNTNCKYLDKNPFKTDTEDALDVRVEPENLDRALRIFSTILRVLRLRGHTIMAWAYWRTYVIVDGESIRIKLLEKRNRVEDKESIFPKTKTVPTGRLRFEITRTKEYHDTAVSVEDASSIKLEDKILNIIAKIEYEAIYVKEFRKEQERLNLELEEKRKKWEIEKQELEKLEKRQEEEMERLKEVFLSAELFAWANVLRTYAERYEAFLNGKETQDDDELEKLRWLKSKVEWIDPFVEHDDELLTDEHKKELIWPKEDGFSYPNPYRLHASWPEFNFWNNPFRRRG